jgi:hypothetical protein
MFVMAKTLLQNITRKISNFMSFKNVISKLKKNRIYHHLPIFSDKNIADIRAKAKAENAKGDMCTSLKPEKQILR